MIPLRTLERFVNRPPAPAARPRCDLCGDDMTPEHAHVVDLEARSIRCACRACGLLFTKSGAAMGKYKTAPDRWLHQPSFRLNEAQWGALQIPVRLAFFFRHSAMNRWAAFYPGPAGAAESLLGLDAWEELAATLPLAQAAAPDIEALLIRGDRGGGFECFLVPIHACYELVGKVKLHWKGFDGGTDAWREIDGFFDAVRSKSRPLPRQGGEP